jgi:hypothetical protein
LEECGEPGNIFHIVIGIVGITWLRSSDICVDQGREYWPCSTIVFYQSVIPCPGSEDWIVKDTLELGCCNYGGISFQPYLLVSMFLCSLQAGPGSEGRIL